MVSRDVLEVHKSVIYDPMAYGGPLDPQSKYWSDFGPILAKTWLLRHLPGLTRLIVVCIGALYGGILEFLQFQPKLGPKDAFSKLNGYIWCFGVSNGFSSSLGGNRGIPWAIGPFLIILRTCGWACFFVHSERLAQIFPCYMGVFVAQNVDFPHLNG